jgi:hypothetical protein
MNISHSDSKILFEIENLRYELTKVVENYDSLFHVSVLTQSQELDFKIVQWLKLKESTKRSSNVSFT